MKQRNNRKRWVAGLLGAFLALCLAPVVANATSGATVADSGSSAWEVSKSKSATQLDENYESDVTLSLPSAQEELVSDVVFVLDKSTSTSVRDDAVNMLDSLRDQVEKTDATVKVGVVIFNTEATDALQLTELTSDNFSTIESAMRSGSGSGTNTHAGMLAGKAMLDEDTSVDAGRKYLVLVSDGITYMYGETGTVTKGYWNNDGSPYYSADPYSWSFKYGNDNPPESWETWLNTIGTLVEADDGSNDAPYADKGSFTGGVAWEKHVGIDGEYATSVDKALYKTWQVYSEAQASGYHCYAMTKSTSTSYAWGPAFIDYLAGGQDATFDQIEKEVFYLLDDGSEVVDVIGGGTDSLSAAYDFEFIDDLSRLTLKVGEDTLDSEKIAGAAQTDANVTSAYGFGRQADGSYDFELWYYENGRDGASEECFVWKINVAVSNFAPVQLTYSVRLTNPSYVVGTHDGLLTNTSATLYPVDTDGGKGDPEEFPRPTVSYEMGSVTVRPAAMTIYMGGDEGYDAVVSGSDGSTVAEGADSLPEPGFYIDLSDDLNELLRESQGTANPSATDLSDLITFHVAGDDSREWVFERYGGDAGSTAYNQFVYRLVPTGENQDAVRLEFTSEDGSTHFTSDDFDPAAEGALYNTYTMGIYAGDSDNPVNLEQIVMDITIDGTTYQKVVNVETSTLTIRYVVDTEGGNPVTGVVNDINDAENPGGDAYAVTLPNATFYINGSQIDLVDGAAPSLLFDSIVGTESGAAESHFDSKLLSKAATAVAAQDEGFQITGHESKYLDLVDANNANAWLMTDGPVTVYWPYPEGTDENTEFHLVHFQGLDRDMTNDEVDGEIDATDPEYISVTNTEHGVMFTLQPEQGSDGLSRVRFSPFVLAWGESDTGTTPGTSTTPEQSGIPQTGDATSYVGVVALLAAGVGIGATGLVVRRRSR